MGKFVVVLFCFLLGIQYIAKADDGFIVSEVTDRDRLWEAWKYWHGKTYSTQDEETTRRTIWEKNMDAIFAHNAAGNSYTLAMNKYGDQVQLPSNTNIIANEEYLDRKRHPVAMGTCGGTTPLSSLDWRTKGVSTGVREEGQSGKVIPYVLTEALECYHVIKTGQSVQLSVQEAMDCCSDSTLASGFDCIIHRTKGLCSAADYPRQPPGNCNAFFCHAAATCKATGHVIKNNETDLMCAVAMTPTVVGIDASQTSMAFYHSGIYYDSHCSTSDLNHALLVVGYGSSGGVDYWICQNTWGTDWGLAGYILIERGKNMCGIASQAFYPI
ncbi:digestive cysteine proteinase 2-like [Branchiostoma floridae x Branchiostoma japonicum]